MSKFTLPPSRDSCRSWKEYVSYYGSYLYKVKILLPYLKEEESQALGHLNLKERIYLSKAFIHMAESIAKEESERTKLREAAKIVLSNVIELMEQQRIDIEE